MAQSESKCTSVGKENRVTEQRSKRFLNSNDRCMRWDVCRKPRREWNSVLDTRAVVKVVGERDAVPGVDWQDFMFYVTEESDVRHCIRASREEFIRVECPLLAVMTEDQGATLVWCGKNDNDNKNERNKRTKTESGQNDRR